MGWLFGGWLGLGGSRSGPGARLPHPSSQRRARVAGAHVADRLVGDLAPELAQPPLPALMAGLLLPAWALLG